jgi:hypothetical protein
MEKYNTSNPLKISPEKSQILNCDTVVASEQYTPGFELRIYRVHTVFLAGLGCI